MWPLAEVRYPQRKHSEPASVGVEAAERLHRHLAHTVEAVRSWGRNGNVGDSIDRVIADGVDGARQNDARYAAPTRGLEHGVDSIDVHSADLLLAMLGRQAAEMHDQRHPPK